MEMHDASGALPFDIRKVQQRYTFTSRQREVLLKHFNNGMTCQSQAYHEKIMTCAREAEVDFDIVRNWIGNVRRKMRIEANKMQSPSGGMMMGDNCEPKLPRLEDLQNLFGNQPAKPMQGAMLRTSVGFSPPLSHPPQLSIPSMNLQTQLGNHQQLILTEDSAVSMANAAAANPVFNAKPSPHPMQITKVVSNTNNERDRPSSSSTSSMVSSAAVHSAGPQSTAQTIFFSNEKEIRENDIRRTMGNIQQS
ncbi:uncharacterized protein LOC102803749, partial [Saccoglossus kowalevskii]|uniref:Uncharacterized protein LOC102803749 n=1 Tax=Saccoglossus kowalevskii TaxID=10224 RepID=A0ABM0MX43_SACKO